MTGEITFKSLSKWHEQIVEKLGWMIIGIDNNQDLTQKSIMGYIAEINMWLELANNKEVSDKDKKNDLEIMIMHINKLKKHVMKDYNFSNSQDMTGGKQRRGSRKGSRKGSRNGTRK